MKNLNQKINETINIPLGQISTVNEAWGTQPTRRFKADLEKIFAEYDKADASKKKKMAANKPYDARQGKGPEAKLAKYPMQILIDKAGYTPKEIKVYHGGRGRNSGYFNEFDKEAYGEFILQQIFHNLYLNPKK